MGVKKQGSKVFRKKNKAGLSTVVVVLIIVLVSLVAVAIIWTVARGLLDRQAEISNLQNKFFKEQVNIVSVHYDEPNLNVTLKKPAGEIKVVSVNVTNQGSSSPDVDVFSVVDLSGSMRQCNGTNLTSNKCTTVMGGQWTSGTRTCTTLPVSAGPLCLGYGATWNDRVTAIQDANRMLLTKILSLPGRRTGLIGYKTAAVASASTDLLTDLNTLNNTLNTWQADSTTCICCGINNATDKLNLQSTDEKFKSMIVMSDGEANVQCGRQGTGDAKTDAIEAACDANATLKNLVIYSVGVQDADEATLTSIAICGGGKYYSVKNTSELVGVYEGIARQIEEKYNSLTSLNYLIFKFYNASNFDVEKVYDIPEVLLSKTYTFNLQGKLSGKITRIEIYPVVTTSYGEDLIGPVLDVWTDSV